MSNFKVKENLDITPLNSNGLAVQGQNALPISGYIIPFLGPVNKIPSGWLLCDGTDGTPDLVGKYIAGWSTTNAPGTYFGSDTHSHNMSWTINTTASGNTLHNHNFNYGFAAGGSSTDHNWGGNRTGGTGNDQVANYIAGSQANVSDNNHSHSNNNIPLASITANAHSHNHPLFTTIGGANDAASGQATGDTHTHTVVPTTNSATSNTVVNSSLISTFYVNFIMKV